MVSIGICTYNRDEFLRGVLGCIIENNCPPEIYELLVVNNNSTDNTSLVCSQFAIAHPEINFRYFLESQQGVAFARNRILKEAKGELLIFIEDDATISANFIKTYIDFFNRRADAIVAGGPIFPLYWRVKEPKWMSRFTRELLTAHLYLGDRERFFPLSKFPGGGNVAFRMEIFKRVGEFNTELGRKGSLILSGEDKDMIERIRRMGIKVHYLPGAVLNHIITADKLSDERFRNLTYRIGVSERMRTLGISKLAYFKRLFSEVVKWAATLVLSLLYTLQLTPQKGAKLIAFRRNVTKGLLELTK